MIAIESFTHRDDDGVHEITAGLSSIADGHPWLRDPAVARKFARDGSQAARQALAQAKRHRPRERQSYVLPAGTTVVPPLHVRTELSSYYKVIVPRQVRSEISNAVRGDSEVGGGLFGSWRDGSVYIGAAIANPTSTEDTRHRTSIDSTFMLEREADGWIPARGWQWIGDYHSHTVYEGSSASPSITDIEGWAAFRRRSPGLYVGLIVSPCGPETIDPSATDPWAFPRFSAWLAHTYMRASVVEPVNVVLPFREL